MKFFEENCVEVETWTGLPWVHQNKKSTEKMKPSTFIEIVNFKLDNAAFITTSNGLYPQS